MITEMVVFDGVPLIVPVIDGRPIPFPVDTIKEFSSYCGAGKGIGDLIVPEYIFFLKITPACFLHDTMWEFAEPTWLEFHATNSMFRCNIDSIIHHTSDNIITEHARYYRSVTYFNAVNTFGAKCFWNVKREQGYEGSLDSNVTTPKKSFLQKKGITHNWVIS